MEATRCRTASLARRQEDGRGSDGALREKGKGEKRQGIDDEVRGYFDEPLRTYTVRRILGPESWHDP